MKKEMEYKTPIFRSEKIGEETKIGSYNCCDACERPLSEYVELENTISFHKETGRRSPVNMFNSYTTVSYFGGKCAQCHGMFCDDCIKKLMSISEDFGENCAGYILLCKNCMENLSDELKSMLEKREKLSKLYDEYGKLEGEILDQYHAYIKSGDAK
jgi:hypothetical protein